MTIVLLIELAVIGILALVVWLASVNDDQHEVEQIIERIRHETKQ